MIKRLVAYISHPAQYHFLKHSIAELNSSGIETKVLIKSKDILQNLLEEDNVPFVNIQEHARGQSKWSILIASFKRTFSVYRIAKKFKADAIIGTDSSVAQAAKLLDIPAFTTLEDDYDIIKNLALLTYPFTTCIIVPTACSVGKYEEKKIPYEGYMKLAYLHPHWFKPNESVIRKYGIQGKYCLIRLAGLTAHHDVGIKGLNSGLVKDIINVADSKGFRVYISSENDLEPQLKPYQLKINHTDIHHVMSYASLLISDSQSMSVEAAMLGTPSIRFSDFAGRISVLEELENKYHLTFGIKTSESDLLISKVSELLSMPNIMQEFANRRKRLLDDKIDVTAFLVWFIKNYPESAVTVKQNPKYQFNFK